MRCARTSITAMLVVSAVFTATHQAAAQICAGSPATPDRPAALANVGWSDGDVGYGARFLANPAGPLALNVGADYSRNRTPAPDFTAYSVGGGLRYEIPVAGAVVCPSAHLGLAHTEARVPGAPVIETRSMTTTAALRLGFVAFDGPRFRVAPFLGGPGTLSLAMDDSGDLRTNSALAGTAGVLMVMSDHLFGVGEVSVVEGSRTIYGIGMGVRFH